MTEIKFICGHVVEFFLPNSLRRLQPSSAFPVPCTFRRVLESELSPIISYGLHLTSGFLVILLFSVPSGPPLNVQIDSTTSTSFTLTWDPPLEPNGIILGYDVMYYECDEPNKKNIYDNIKERKHTIKDLHPYRCYRMHVACESSGGLGAFSDWVKHWTEPGGEHGVRVLSSCVASEKYCYPSSQCLLGEIPGVWYSWFGFSRESNNQ